MHVTRRSQRNPCNFNDRAKACEAQKQEGRSAMKLHKNRHEISHQSVTSWGRLVSNLLKEVGVTEARRALSLRLQIVPRGIFEI